MSEARIFYQEDCNLSLLDGKTVSYTHLRAHETKANIVCRLLLEKKKKQEQQDTLN